MTALPQTPDNLAANRIALHRLAAYVIAPARYRVTERFGLRATDAGFGTPDFEGRRIRVEGGELIDQDPVEVAANFWRESRDRLAKG